METELTNTTNISELIIDTINNLLNNLFSSIDNSVYETLDKLTFIDLNIFQDSFIAKFFQKRLK